MFINRKRKRIRGLFDLAKKSVEEHTFQFGTVLLTTYLAEIDGKELRIETGEDVFYLFPRIKCNVVGDDFSWITEKDAKWLARRFQKHIGKTGKNAKFYRCA